MDGLSLMGEGGGASMGGGGGCRKGGGVVLHVRIPSSQWPQARVAPNMVVLNVAHLRLIYKEHNLYSVTVFI